MRDKVNQSRIRRLIAPVKAGKYTSSFRKPFQLAVFDENDDGECGDTTPVETPVASPTRRIWSMRALETLACGFTGTLVVANERILPKKNSQRYGVQTRAMAIVEVGRSVSGLWLQAGARTL